jgi:hypothetical protein
MWAKNKWITNTGWLEHSTLNSCLVMNIYIFLARMSHLSTKGGAVRTGTTHHCSNSTLLTFTVNTNYGLLLCSFTVVLSPTIGLLKKCLSSTISWSRRWNKCIHENWYSLLQKNGLVIWWAVVALAALTWWISSKYGMIVLSGSPSSFFYCRVE